MTKINKIFLLVLFLIGSGGATSLPYPSAAADLESLYQEISYYHGLIQNIKDQENNLQNQISLIDSEIKESELQIEATQLKINGIEEEIREIAFAIGIKEKKIEEHKTAMADYLRIINELDATSPVEIFFSARSFSDIIDQVEYISVLQAKTNDLIKDYVSAKTDLETTRQQQREVKDQEMGLLKMQDEQKNVLEEKRHAKEIILNDTKGEEEQYQKIINESSDYWETVTRANFSAFDTDELINIKDAFDFAALAADRTGVRKALLLAVITQESYFGMDNGTGHYQSNMHPSEHSDFLALCEELGLNPDERKISAKPTTYPGWGGAMGPAQIMPSEWQGIKDEVAKLTEHEKPSPWNGQDAFVGCALILKRNGAATRDRDQEREAVGRYFAGGAWKEFSWYADQVMEKTAWFE